MRQCKHNPQCRAAGGSPRRRSPTVAEEAGAAGIHQVVPGMACCCAHAAAALAVMQAAGVAIVPEHRTIAVILDYAPERPLLMLLQLAAGLQSKAMNALLCKNASTTTCAPAAE